MLQNSQENTCARVSFLISCRHLRTTASGVWALQVYALQIHYVLLREEHLPRTQERYGWNVAVWSIMVKGYQSSVIVWNYSSKFAFIDRRS